MRKPESISSNKKPVKKISFLFSVDLNYRKGFTG